MEDLPQGKLRDKGIPVDNISGYDSSKEQIVLVTGQSDLNLYKLIFVTASGMIKVVEGGEFEVKRNNVASTVLQDGDRIIKIEVMKDQQNIVFQTQKGFFLKFPVEQIPQKKKTAVGVRGMSLGDDDEIEEVYFTNNLESNTVIYKEKELSLNHLRLANRAAKGSRIKL